MVCAGILVSVYNFYSALEPSTDVRSGYVLDMCFASLSCWRVIGASFVQSWLAPWRVQSLSALIHVFALCVQMRSLRLTANELWHLLEDCGVLSPYLTAADVSSSVVCVHLCVPFVRPLLRPRFISRL